jgi:altronate dehydratase
VAEDPFTRAQRLSSNTPTFQRLEAQMDIHVGLVLDGAALPGQANPSTNQRAADSGQPPP